MFHTRLILFVGIAIRYSIERKKTFIIKESRPFVIDDIWILYTHPFISDPIVSTHSICFS